ncbi:MULTISPECIES: hypothetical protein [unclassified Streptomyces]|uniref:hypothetical protein n=1 Tax=unclassified Streptomyces TaxID=2593676 RepID=UPI002DDB84D2|nr:MULTISPECIES: hypothetical protein [unclassified Streptomyces]WSS46776.1 hypothetical protein OG220_40100 [Streptomyces sp. NBC_01187]WSA97705.1 hypothetical protein OIE63_40110 [Streptomyces sp. NBC_01795]WSB82044.1 hypothetical protein OHB04_40700 [Streptomyces sp. NBC_01775]WSS18017.1 hypothetical protein OG533_39780 [Streptomyces sp. NBC_01186]WSS47007.1 hypothetical protein OG220_41525 [Streptomyces sp. NBC_01187]
MKRRPPGTALPTNSSSTTAGPLRPGRIQRRKRRYRDEASLHLLRGLCYGTGTGAAGLLLYYLQQHL